MNMSRARGANQDDSQNNVKLLEEWMSLYGNDVLHLAYSYVHNYHRAEDVVQDVFLRAWRNFDSFQGDSSIKTWLLSITANRSKDLLRSWSVKHEVSDDGVVLQNIRVTDTESQVEARLQADKLWEMVRGLPEKYREIVVLYYQRELSGHEIAEVLDISEQAVRTRLHRGRQLLKQALGEEGTGFDG